MSTTSRSRTALVMLATMLATATGTVLVMQQCSAAVPPPIAVSDQPTLAPMLERVLPAVVNVVTETESEVAHPLMNDPFFRRFFDMPEGKRRSSGLGSGVIINADKGYVLTNAHVVANATKITLKLHDDRETEAELIGSDPETDLALLKIDEDDLVQVPLGDSDQTRVGDFVVAVGNPFGLNQTVTSGIVSGLGRSGMGNRYEDFIQTDASINPGNSGGALVDLNGRLIGINTAILSRGGGNIGIGFAIPVNLAQAVVAQIIEYGEVQRGMLGVIGQDLTGDLAEAFGHGTTHGVVVAEVIPDSAAEKAGIKSGDIIVGVDGKPLKDFGQLRNSIGLMRIGDEVKLDIVREGKRIEIEAEIGEPTELGSATATDTLHAGLAGATFTNNAEGAKGVLVSAVEEGSEAHRNGLRQGDVITSLNRKPVETVQQLRKLTRNTDERLVLHIKRGAGALFLVIDG